VNDKQGMNKQMKDAWFVKKEREKATIRKIKFSQVGWELLCKADKKIGRGREDLGSPR